MNTIKSDSKKNKILLNVAPYAIFGIVILIILSYQIRTHTAIFVSDGYFHFSRFYDAAQQIKTNNYSFFNLIGDLTSPVGLSMLFMDHFLHI